jgi:hypothetical protein
MAAKSQQLFGVTFNIGFVAKILTITNHTSFWDTLYIYNQSKTHGELWKQIYCHLHLALHRYSFPYRKIDIK